jgi:hypothetical protein
VATILRTDVLNEVARFIHVNQPSVAVTAHMI